MTASDIPPLQPRSRALRRRQSRPASSARRPGAIYQLRVELAYLEPAIWRRVTLRSDCRLDRLHDVLQILFSWYDSHLHAFTSYPAPGSPPRRFAASSPYGDSVGDGEPEAKTRLDQVLHEPGDLLFYTYDFGDSWEHVITLEEVRPLGSGEEPPRVLGGEGAAPPEDCGGVPGYENLVAILTDPAHEEYDEMSEWFEDIGDVPAADFDPAFVDLEDLDRRVRASVV